MQYIIIDMRWVENRFHSGHRGFDLKLRDNAILLFSIDDEIVPLSAAL